MVMDYGHLTSAGSDFVAQTIISRAFAQENLPGKEGKVSADPPGDEPTHRARGGGSAAAHAFAWPLDGQAR
jgi:hypothetical protein